MESDNDNSNQSEEDGRYQRNYNSGYLEMQFTKELIEIYKKHTCLWKTGSRKDRTLISRAYRELVTKYREVYPQADLTTVKTRLQSMKSAYRKCLRRVLDTYESAKSGGTLYVPKLWYFRHLLFLHESRYPDLPALFEEAVRDCGDGEDDDINMNESYSVRCMPRKMIKELLIEFRNQDCLWKPDKVNDKWGKVRAYNKLTDICRKYNPDAHHEFVRSIIRTCRSTYRKETRRILNTVTENEQGEVVATHVPKLWYFHLLSFLNEELFEHLPPVSAEEDTSIKLEPVARKRKKAARERFSPAAVAGDDSDCGDDEAADDGDDFADFTHVDVSRDDDEPGDENDTAETVAQSGDLFDSIGQTVAHKLRLLSRVQRIIAEKLIHEVLYNAEMERLDTSTTLLVVEPDDKLAL